MAYFRLIGGLALLLLFGGCVRQYTPEASRPMEPIHEFSSANSVSLVNGQPSTAQVRFFRSMEGNYNAWTKVAIEIATRELKNRGMTIANGATKSITMAVEASSYDVGMIELKSQITMRVQTSDGYSAVYIGENSSYMAAIPGRLIDGAMMRVVHEMLMDPRIITFLTQ
jgi:hypothetical protein